jgi:hypothetical protein
MVQPPTRSHTEIHDETVLEAKSRLNIEKMLAIASTETLIPEILAGSNSTRLDVLHDFGAMKTSLMWDAQDGAHGTKNYILRSIEHLRDGFGQRLRSEFEWDHPDFYQFCELAFSKSLVAFEEFGAEVSDFNRTLLVRAHGEPPHSKEQEKEVWPLVLIFPQVYWEEVSKVRACAKRLKTMDPTTATASMMWAVVQAHAKHGEFKASRFREHPRINPKVLSYLFERCVNKRDFLTVKSAQSGVSSSMNSVKASVDQLRVQVDRLATKVAGGQGGKHDGDGGGGAAGNVRNRRGNAARDRAPAAGAAAGGGAQQGE